MQSAHDPLRDSAALFKSVIKKGILALILCENRFITARCTIVQSAVLRLHVVRPSVCNVSGSVPHRLKILETNCTDN